MGSGPSQSGAFPLRDLNRDGVVDQHDILPFILALSDEQAYLDLYGCSREELLAVADRNRDGVLTPEDADGFGASLGLAGGAGLMGAGGLGGGAVALSGGSGGSSAVIDLDIDSDNNAGPTNYPDRSAAEDAIEAVRPGKYVWVGETGTKARMVLDALPANAQPGMQVWVSLSYPQGTTRPADAWWVPLPTSAAVQVVNPSSMLTHTLHLLGDMNSSGTVDSADIDAFIQAVSNPTAYQSTYGLRAALVGDTNGDGECDTADVDSFVQAVIIGGCQ